MGTSIPSAFIESCIPTFVQSDDKYLWSAYSLLSSALAMESSGEQSGQ